MDYCGLFYKVFSPFTKTHSVIQFSIYLSTSFIPEARFSQVPCIFQRIISDSKKGSKTKGKKKKPPIYERLHTLISDEAGQRTGVESHEQLIEDAHTGTGSDVSSLKLVRICLYVHVTVRMYFWFVYIQTSL